MDQPSEFVSRPFDFSKGGVLTVEARALRPVATGLVEFSLEGSEDKTYWTALVAGSVSADQRVEIPCQDRAAPWARVRLRSFGGEAHVSARIYR